MTLMLWWGNPDKKLDTRCEKSRMRKRCMTLSMVVGKSRQKIVSRWEKRWLTIFFSPMVVCNKFCITFISLNQFIMKNNVSTLSFREWELHIRKQCINVEPIKHSEIKSGWRVNWCLYGKILECKKRS
jgi:hypothetical protein